MRSLKEVRDMLLFAHSSLMKILSMTKIFLLLYDLNKSSQNSRAFSLILKNRQYATAHKYLLTLSFLNQWKLVETKPRLFSGCKIV